MIDGDLDIHWMTHIMSCKHPGGLVDFGESGVLDSR